MFMENNCYFITTKKLDQNLSVHRTTLTLIVTPFDCMLLSYRYHVDPPELPFSSAPLPYMVILRDLLQEIYEI